MCCAYNSCGNRDVESLCKECTCSFEEMASHHPACRRITLEDRRRSYEDAAFAKKISHSKVPSASTATVLADARPEREEEDRCAKECKDAGLATTNSQDETVPAVHAKPATAGAKTTGLEDDSCSETGSNVDFGGGGGDDAISAYDSCSI